MKKISGDRVIIDREQLLALLQVIRVANDLCDQLEADKNMQDHPDYAEVRLLVALDLLRHSGISMEELSEVLP